MAKKKKRRKLPGRWCCGHRRPNESFSRKRRVCSKCVPLGREEIAYRQHALDIERLLTHSGHVQPTQRRTFAKYLAHEDPRVRAYAEDVRTWPARERESLGALQATADAAEAAGRAYAEQMDIPYEEDEEEEDQLDGDHGWAWETDPDAELPF